MSIYGRKFLSRSIEKRIVNHAETMDAILWDIDTATKLCRVKIQGSTDLVTAHYPENWQQTPDWLKPGNSVRIIFRGGSKGLIEITGHGQTVPTLSTGPTPPTPDDVVVSGGVVVPQPSPDMSVHINAGVYRINGVSFTLTEQDVNVDPAPSSGNYRYDIFVVGIDGTVDYVKGTASPSPTMPMTPANHVLVGYVLLASGVTAITQSQINAQHSTATIVSVTMTIADDELEYGKPSTDVIITAIDQYGNPIAKTGEGWYATLAITSGNGLVSSAEEPGGSTVSVHQHSAGATHSHFTYTRDGTTNEVSPAMLLGTITEEGVPYSIQGVVYLYDSDGNPVPPEPLPSGSTGEQIITFSSNIVIDWNLGETARLTLTGNCTIGFVNWSPGGVYRLVLIQDGAGSHLVNTWYGINYWQNGVPPTLTATAGHRDVVTFLYEQSEVTAAITLDFYGTTGGDIGAIVVDTLRVSEINSTGFGIEGGLEVVDSSITVSEYIELFLETSGEPSIYKNDPIAIIESITISVETLLEGSDNMLVSEEVTISIV